MTREEMRWIDQSLEGSISKESFRLLQQAMRDDATVLRHYQQQAAVHGQLEWELKEGTPSEFLANRRPRRALNFRVLAAAAAALILASAVVFWFVGRRPPEMTPPMMVAAEPGPSLSVASLTEAEDAVWGDEGVPDDERFKPGFYSLEKGKATLVFDSGATVALMSPARIQVEGHDRVVMLEGRGTVWIPDQAAGFLLETPTARLSDQDTRFAVAVNQRGHTELHVLDGVLELVQKFGDYKSVLVRSDRPVSVEKEAMIDVASPFDHRNFPQLPDRMRTVNPGFVHWSFDRAVASKVSEASFPDTGIKRPGGASFPAIVQTRNQESAVALVPGRFGNAIQLNGQGGYMRTDLPGVPGHQARTVAFWVRIPPGTPIENSYAVISWGTKTVGGKWQVGWNTGYDVRGTVGAIRTEFESGFSVGSTDLRDGRWHHVASVFLGGEEARPESHIRHYVDGRLESVSGKRSVIIDTVAEGEHALPVALGRRLESDTNATFKGLIDEVYLFSEALTPSQIEDLYLKNFIETHR